MAVPSPPKSSTIEICTFALTIPTSTQSASEPSSSEFAIGIDIVQYLDITDLPHIHARFCLIKTLLHSEAGVDPVVLELAADAPDASPDDAKDIKTTFRFGADKEVMEQLLQLKVLESVNSAAGDEHFMVRVILPDKEVTKRCAQCGRWEQHSEDGARLAVCSGCKLAWSVGHPGSSSRWKG